MTTGRINDAPDKKALAALTKLLTSKEETVRIAAAKVILESPRW